MFNHIIYTTDFSETAENAFPHALVLSMLFKSKLTLLYARVPLQDDLNNPHFQFPELEMQAQKIEERAKELLERKKTEDLPALQTHIQRGIVPDQAILLAVSELRGDLIVMGTHGRRGLDEFILGSVTQGVVKHARCAVLTVRKDVSAPDPEHPYRQVLVPVDLSPSSESLLQQSWSFCQAADSHLHLLHVVHEEEDKKEAEAMLHQMVNRTGVEAKIHLLVGIPEPLILQTAREVSADLIIMSRKGASSWKYILLGSTTERIIRTSTVPVLIFPQA